MLNSALLLLSITAAPSAGAALFSDTAQVLTSSAFNDVDVQVRLLRVTAAVRLMVAVLETPLRVAVRVAL